MCLNSSILHMDPGTVDFFLRQKSIHRGYLQPNGDALGSRQSERGSGGQVRAAKLGSCSPSLPIGEELLSLRSLYWGPHREEPHQAEISLCQYIPVSKQHRVIPISKSAASRDYFHCILLAGSMGLLLSSASRNSHISSALCYGRTPETEAPALIWWQHMHIGRLLSH